LAFSLFFPTINWTYASKNTTGENGMKQLLLILFIAGLVLSQIGCSTDPESQPRFRIKNDRATKANLQIKTSGGNTVTINDVLPGQITDYRDAAAGQIEVTAVIQDETVSPTATFDALMNGSYTVIVANTTPPSINVISP
jgi:hypothetical protein